MLTPKSPWPGTLLRHFPSSHAARELLRDWQGRTRTSTPPEATADFVVAAHRLLSYDESGQLLLILERIYSGAEKLEVPPEWEYWIRSISGRAFLIHGGRAAGSRLWADAGADQEGDPGRNALAQDLIWPALPQRIAPHHRAPEQAPDAPTQPPCQFGPRWGKTADFCGSPGDAGFPAYRLSFASRSLEGVIVGDDEPSRDLIHMLEVLSFDEPTAAHASREINALLPRIRALPKLNSWYERLIASLRVTPPSLPLPQVDQKMRILAAHLQDPLRGEATRYASAHLAHQVLKHGSLEEKLALVCASGELPSPTLDALLISNYAREALAAVRRAIVWQRWQRGHTPGELSLWAELEGDPVARTLAGALHSGRPGPLDAEEQRQEVKRLGLGSFVVASLGGRHTSGSTRLFVRALDGCPAFAQTAPDGRYLVKSQLFPNESRDALASPPGP